MTTGPVVGPFDRLIIVNATTYTLTTNGGALGSSPASVGENKKVVSFTSSSAIAVTLPPGNVLGFECDLHQAGTGVVTVTGVGVTVNGVANGITASTAQYQRMHVQSVDQDVYIITHEDVMSTHS